MRTYSILILLTTLSVSLSARCIDGNCKNGNGTYISDQGAKYMGQWHRGMRHGEGMMITAEGDQYRGQFYQNDFHGKGKLSYQSGDTYHGAWKEGRQHGQGTYEFATGEKYVGSFQAGVIAGKGTFFYRDGSRYEGEWANNLRHGYGTLYEASGQYQQGYWDRGRLTTADLDTEPINTITTKDCSDGSCDAVQGTFHYADGSHYVGEFKEGKPDGQGVCYYANGDVYRGSWAQHSPHGRGVMTFAATGKSYGAEWSYGQVVRQVFDNYSDLYDLEAADAAVDDADVKIYAVIVGVSNYDHLPALRYTDDDAYQLYAFLKSPEGGAVPDDQIQLLIDDAASQQRIIRSVNEVVSQADANDVLLFYLSGHGFDGAFAPHDFDGYNNAIAYEDLVDVFEKSRARQRLFIADACHSGSLSTARSGSIAQSLATFYQRLTDSKASTAIMMSSKADEVSLEYSGMRQGVFSHYLIAGLKGAADFNSDKIVALGELYRYIDKGVKSYTNGAQHPKMVGAYDSDMPVGVVR